MNPDQGSIHSFNYSNPLPKNKIGEFEMIPSHNDTFISGSKLSISEIQNTYVDIGLVVNFTGIYDLYFENCRNNSNCTNIFVSDA